MLDLLFVAVMLALFALAALFVRACDRIIGSDDEAFSGASPANPRDPGDPGDPVDSLKAQHERTAA